MLALNRVALAAVLLGLVTSCSSKWQGDGGLHERAVMTDAFGNTHYLFPDIARQGVPRVPVPNKLRPCCAFGSQLRVNVGSMPILGFELKNVIDLGSLGVHTYDNGLLSVGEEQTGSLFTSEKNGLLYTCRGGFIDTAHLRDYADWTLFLSAWVARHLEIGNAVELADEGGVRRIVLEPVDAPFLEAHGRRAIAVAFGDWLAFRLSIWHEIATWYGWSAIQMFPERASAFSPEDLYSNILGGKIARSIIEVGGASSETLYNHNMDRWIRGALTKLGAVESETGRTLAVALDGFWWDSQIRLPDPELIKRRNFKIGHQIWPWRIEDSRAYDKVADLLADKCGRRDDPIVFPNAESLGSERISSYVRIEIEVDEELERFPFPRPPSRKITQADFPAIVEQIVKENAVEFGAGTNLPH